jgi:hypothetical protein
VRVRVLFPPGFAPRAPGAGAAAAACAVQAQPSGAALNAAERSLAWTLPRLPAPGEAPIALKARLTFDAAAAAPLRPGAARHPTAQLATVVEFECSGGEARAIGASSGVGVHIQITPRGSPSARGAVVSRTIVHRLRVRVETRVAPAAEREGGGEGGGLT